MHPVCRVLKSFFSTLNLLLYCLLFLLLFFMFGTTECGRRLDSLWCHVQHYPLLVRGWRRGKSSRAAGFTGAAGGWWRCGADRRASRNHHYAVFCDVPPRHGGFVQGKLFRLVCLISGWLGHHLVKRRVWAWTRLQLGGTLGRSVNRASQILIISYFKKERNTHPKIYTKFL